MPVYAAIDLKSFYASVECVEHKLERHHILHIVDRCHDLPETNAENMAD